MKRTRTPVYRLLTAFVVLFFVGKVNLVQAQNACINPLFKGDFKVDKPVVCVGNPVTIIDVPTSLTNAGYNFQYDGNSPIDKIVLDTQNKTFTYEKPGSYTILQGGSGNGSGGGTIFCQSVTVLPLDPISVTVKSCAGRKVTVVPDVSTLGQYDAYVIRWGDGTREELSRAAMEANPEHTYPDNGTDMATVFVEGIYKTTTTPCTSPTPPQMVKLLPTVTQPAITTLKTTGDNTITLQYQASAETVVQLYQKINGTYTDTGQKGTSSGEFRVQTDAKQVQCFQVVAQNACSNAGLTSDEVCSLVLDVKVANKKNTLSWQPYAGVATGSQFRYYRITRNNAPIGGSLTNSTTATYTDDNNIVCGTSYCYSLVATIAGSVAQTEVSSASVCVTGINGDVPDNLNNVVASVEDNRPTVTVSLPAPASGALASYTLVVSRADGASGRFSPVGSVLNDSVFVDPNANSSAGSYCYQVTYQGVCGLTLPPSQPVCTVFLNATGPTNLDWTDESPFAPGSVAEYTVEVIDSLNGTIQRISLGTSTRYEPDPNDPNAQTYTYRITATSAGKTSYSNLVTLYRDAKIWVPDAFTPNGDQMNDAFSPKGVREGQFLMNIYSRWGEAVYSTTDKTKGWDGLVNGEPASPGQYMYRIELDDGNGQKTVRTGAVLLIR